MRPPTTLTLLLISLLPILLPANGPAQDAPIGTSGERVTLQKQLETGLKARRPQEFAFIKRVVQMVEHNQLPRQLVEETFVWARKKKRYPYVYFERALRVRASNIGIRV